MAGAMLDDTSSKCFVLLLPIRKDRFKYLQISELNFSVMMSFQDIGQDRLSLASCHEKN